MKVMIDCIMSLIQDLIQRVKDDAISPISIFFKKEIRKYAIKSKRQLRKMISFTEKHVLTGTYIKRHSHFFISILLILILLSPLLFTRSCSWTPNFSSNNTGNIGSTFGIMNPFIAIIAALLTYLAFKTQYDANQKMLKKDEKQEVEHQFYEMLHIHKENVNELKWEQWSILESSSPIPTNTKSTLKDKLLYNNKYAYQQTTGRKVFDCHKIEYIFIEQSIIDAITAINTINPNNYSIHFSKKKYKHYKRIIQLAYKVYMEGLSSLKEPFKGNNAATAFFNICNNRPQKIADQLKNKNFSSFFNIGTPTEHLFNDTLGYIHLYVYFALCFFKKNMLPYAADSIEINRYLTGSNLFNGHIYELNHYYRHLYQTVKIVVNYDESILSYTEKRKFLRMLRAQLTSDEQLLLFYNWISGYGIDWECSKNHFFTEFRMIHNLNYKDSIFFHSVGAKVIIDKIKKTNPKYNDYKNDNLFEFEDRLN